VKWTRLSRRSFRDDEARLSSFAPAYNLGNFLRRLVLPRFVKHGLLTMLREKWTEIGAKVVRHAKYLTTQSAEVAPRRGQETGIAAVGPEPPDRLSCYRASLSRHSQMPWGKARERTSRIDNDLESGLRSGTMPGWFSDVAPVTGICEMSD